MNGLDWSVGGWAIVALGVLGVARRIAPMLGPIGGVAASLIDGAAKSFMPKEHKEAQARMQVMEQSAWKIVEAIEECEHPIAQELKKKISKNTPAEFNALFDAWKKDRAG
jgi:hypothetical protein